MFPNLGYSPYNLGYKPSNLGYNLPNLGNNHSPPGKNHSYLGNYPSGLGYSHCKNLLRPARRHGDCLGRGGGTSPFTAAEYNQGRYTGRQYCGPGDDGGGGGIPGGGGGRAHAAQQACPGAGPQNARSHGHARESTGLLC